MQPSIFYTALGHAIHKTGLTRAASCASVPTLKFHPSAFAGCQQRRTHSQTVRQIRVTRRWSPREEDYGSPDQFTATREDALVPPSRRGIKSQRTPPSEHVVEGLTRLGHDHALPAVFPTKSSLSYKKRRKARPRTPAQRLVRYVWPQFAPEREDAEATGVRGLALSRPLVTEIGPEPLTLPDVLAEYLKTIAPMVKEGVEPTDEALLQVFDDPTMAFLDARGFDEADVMTWAWIMTAPTAEAAALRMLAAENHNSITAKPSKKTPTFVFLFLLRRPYINARDLKLLMAHAWGRLKGASPMLGPPEMAQVEPPHPPDTLSHETGLMAEPTAEQLRNLDETTIMTLVVRLLRHARKVWPPALVSVAEMVSQHIDGSSDPQSALRPETSARLTRLYNRVLSLLALPSSLNTFLAVPYHQRAQFSLIKRMTTFEPPLSINQEGFRAVTTIQVAHKKTLQERRWAKKKAPSWPPWKEEKLGIDAVRHADDGTTRALHVMTQQTDAGYAPDAWEQTARIFSGWDTDRSPTIQTRAFLERPRSGSGSGRGGSGDDAAAARIRATRTVDEAWSCFLAHEADRLEPSADMYFAMLEKRIYGMQPRVRSEAGRPGADGAAPEKLPSSDDASAPVPGDVREVFRPPGSQRDAVYLRSPPPQPMRLFEDMLARGLTPSPQCLAFFVRESNSLRQALMAMSQSKLVTPVQLDALTRLDGPLRRRDEAGVADQLRSLPLLVFTAYVERLSRQSLKKSRVFKFRSLRTENVLSNASLGKLRGNPIRLAFRLLRLRAPTYRPAWNAVMAAIARRGSIVTTEYERTTPLEQDLLSWTAMRDVIRAMNAAGVDLDATGFQRMCVTFEKAMRACDSMGLYAGERGADVEIPISLSQDAAVRQAVHDILHRGATEIRRAFRSLVGVDVPDDPEPTVSSGPAPSDWSSMQAIDPSIFLPRLLNVPAPAQLHQYVRALGRARDYDGLLGLVHWMVKFNPELEELMYEASNGRRLFRRVLVAMRFFLEGGYRRPVDADDAAQAWRASDELSEHFREAIDGERGWGGWPTDLETEKYREIGERERDAADRGDARDKRHRREQPLPPPKRSWGQFW